MSIAITKQNIFPGAYIEDRWDRVNKIRKAPSYAIRLALGAAVTMAPNANQEYASLTFEGREFVLHIENYALVKFMSEMLVGKWKSEGYIHDFETRLHLRFSPNLIIESLYWLTDHAIATLDLPLEYTKIFWPLPDLGVCGEYRSRKPFLYMQEFWAGEKHELYAEHTANINPSSIDWFDVILMHRCPPPQLVSLFQRLASAGKYMVYEYDDDLFNIPDWNLNNKRIGPREQAAAKACIDMADMVICSTEELISVSERPDVCMVGPNLIEMNNFEQVPCDRKLNHDWCGYRPRMNNQRIEWHNHIDKNRPIKYNVDDLDPIRILWTGSNTHDKDLDQIISPMIEIAKRYAPAVRFVFFGYIPTEFIVGIPEAGNLDVKLEVKPEYRYFVSYIEAVEHKDFAATLKSIDPDFALCPLDGNSFNLSKSNLKVLELGAMGVPCIATDYGPYTFINNDVDGIKIQLDKPEAWIESIEDLIVHCGIRQSLGLAMRQRILNDFSWNIDGAGRQQWDAIFERILSESREKKQHILETIAAKFPEAITKQT